MGRVDELSCAPYDLFVGIGVVPMVAVGVLVYSLISHSERAKAEARADGLAAAAVSLYVNESRGAPGP